MADGDAGIAQDQRRPAIGPERVAVAHRFTHDMGTGAQEIFGPRRGDDRGGKGGVAGQYPKAAIGDQKPWQ
jgi:hypothetical protein